MSDIKFEDIEQPIIEYNGKLIFQNDIDLLIEKYIELLPNRDNIYKVSGFSGLLDYIYKNKLRTFYNRNSNYIDYKCLDLVFNNIYIPLCRLFDKAPKIITFCSCLAKIDNNNLSDVKNGITSKGHSRITISDTLIVKKWYEICESSLTEKAIEENSIGAIFGLKSLYGYRDNTTLTIESGSMQQHDTPEQIAARHKSAQLPQKPDI